MSNHPPSVTANIPADVNKRLSPISLDDKMFETAAPIYREALAKSGYEYELKFDPDAANPRSKDRNILLYNPPFNLSAKSNIASDFLNLLDRSFPHGYPLRKLLNRNTVKVSYSCTPNMEKIKTSRNSKLLSTPPPEKQSCSCLKHPPAPVLENASQKTRCMKPQSPRMTRLRIAILDCVQQNLSKDLENTSIHL